jgi:hypothetical protein
MIMFVGQHLSATSDCAPRTIISLSLTLQPMVGIARFDPIGTENRHSRVTIDGRSAMVCCSTRGPLLKNVVHFPSSVAHR